MTLAGRGAVVTGGSRGIGLAVARALAEAGAAVVVAARAPDRLQAVAAELGAAGRRAWAVACDVSDPEGVRTLAREAETRLGHVDILVNNAGISHSAPVQKTTLEDWNRLLTVNATGPFLCTQAFLPSRGSAEASTSPRTAHRSTRWSASPARSPPRSRGPA